MYVNIHQIKCCAGSVNVSGKFYVRFKKSFQLKVNFVSCKEKVNL
jgi:hypothetical protein